MNLIDAIQDLAARRGLRLPGPGHPEPLAVLDYPSERRLKQDPIVWKNFQRFPKSYQHIRIGWIVAARKRREVFEQRLRYFIRMTAQNKRFGMVQ